MRSVFVKILSLFLLLCLVVGCSAQNFAPAPTAPSAPQMSTDYNSSSVSPSAPPELSRSDYGEKDMAGGVWDESAAEPTSQPSGGSSLPNETAKRIIIGDVAMQTTEFDATTASISAVVAKYGGYFESSSLHDNNYFYEGVKRRGAYYTARIPAERYSDFKNEVLTVAHIVNQSENSQDVSEQFFDLEARLKTLRIQQDRYMSLLEKADTMEDIITLERALSEVQYEIEHYTGTLKKLSAQVDYATLHIAVEEVSRLDDARNMPVGLGERLLDALRWSTSSTIEFLEDLLINLVSLIPLLVLFIPIILIFLLLLHRARKKRKKSALAKMADNPPEEKQGL